MTGINHDVSSQKTYFQERLKILSNSERADRAYFWSIKGTSYRKRRNLRADEFLGILMGEI